MAALQQQLDAADGDRLVNLPEHLVEAEDVAFGRSDRPVERAEVALRDADVRVVDVAIDDVGDDRLRVLARADRVGQLPEQRRRRTAIERQRLVGAQRARPREPCRRCDRLSSSIAGIDGLRRNRLTASTTRPTDARRPQIKPQLAACPARRRFGRVAVEQLEPGALVGAEMVLDIIPQISGADRLARRLVRESTAARSRRLRSTPSVPRLLQRQHIVGRQSTRGRPAQNAYTNGRPGRRSSRPRRDRSFSS